MRCRRWKRKDEVYSKQSSTPLFVCSPKLGRLNLATTPPTLNLNLDSPTRLQNSLITPPSSRDHKPIFSLLSEFQNPRAQEGRVHSNREKSGASFIGARPKTLVAGHQARRLTQSGIPTASAHPPSFTHFLHSFDPSQVNPQTRIKQKKKCVPDFGPRLCHAMPKLWAEDGKLQIFLQPLARRLPVPASPTAV